jgi:hypothetical protein
LILRIQIPRLRWISGIGTHTVETLVQ